MRTRKEEIETKVDNLHVYHVEYQLIRDSFRVLFLKAQSSQLWAFIFSTRPKNSTEREFESILFSVCQSHHMESSWNRFANNPKFS